MLQVCGALSGSIVVDEGDVVPSAFRSHLEAFQHGGKVLVSQAAPPFIHEQHAQMIAPVGFQRPCGRVGQIAHLPGNLPHPPAGLFTDVRLAAQSLAYGCHRHTTAKGNTDIGGGFNDDPLWLVGAVCAEAALGRGNEAFDIYRRICPAYLEEKSDVHETEPYCYSQMVTGRASGNPGHAKNSWLTGTASWTFLSISQSILGIYPDYDGLRIAPCLPDELEEYTVIRRFRGCAYTIHVKRTGEKSLSVDDRSVPGDTIPLCDRVKAHVEVTL